jgi:hypothetical protein
MAYSLTYTSLVSEIQSYLEDNAAEFQTELPAIIQRAQDRIQVDLDLAMWSTVATLSISSATVTRPTTWLKLSNIILSSTGLPLQLRTQEWIRMFNAAGATGRPRYYAELGETQIYVAPTPDTTYTAAAEVTIRQDALSVSNSSNWISSNLGAALLNACLTECERFLLAPERVPEFEAEYQREIGLAKKITRGSSGAEYSPVAAGPMPAGDA